MLVNAKIKRIGLYYIGHYHSISIQVELELRGGMASIEIPFDKTDQFMLLFDGDLDIENGVFVDDLKGVPVVLKMEGEDGRGRIVAIGDILAKEDELVPLD